MESIFLSLETGPFFQPFFRGDKWIRRREKSTDFSMEVEIGETRTTGEQQRVEHA